MGMKGPSSWQFTLLPAEANRKEVCIMDQNRILKIRVSSLFKEKLIHNLPGNGPPLGLRK